MLLPNEYWWPGYDHTYYVVLVDLVIPKQCPSHNKKHDNPGNSHILRKHQKIKDFLRIFLPAACFLMADPLRPKLKTY